MEIERLDRPVLIVGQRIRRRAIGSTFDPVALPALQFLEQRLSRLDPIRGYGGLRRDLYGRAWFFCLPAFRKMFYVRYQISPRLVR